MKNQNLIIILIILFVSVCICPVILSLLYFVIDSSDPGSFSETLGTLCLAGLCILPVLATFAALGLKLVDVIRSPKAARRLADEMGLQQLNEAPKDLSICFGGIHAKRSFVIKTGGKAYRYYAAERSRTGVRFYLRMIMKVRVDQPLRVLAYRPPKDAKKNPQSFEEAFELENAAKLDPQVQEAMFAFVQKGYRTGITISNIRINKGLRNLHLVDRTAVDDRVLDKDILPDAHVILVHDHPDTNIDKETLLDFLDDLAEVARAIEDQFTPFDPNKTIISKGV